MLRFMLIIILHLALSAFVIPCPSLFRIPPFFLFLSSFFFLPSQGNGRRVKVTRGENIGKDWRRAIGREEKKLQVMGMGEEIVAKMRDREEE